MARNYEIFRIYMGADLADLTKRAADALDISYSEFGRNALENLIEQLIESGDLTMDDLGLGADDAESDE